MRPTIANPERARVERVPLLCEQCSSNQTYREKLSRHVAKKSVNQVSVKNDAVAGSGLGPLAGPPPAAFFLGKMGKLREMAKNGGNRGKWTGMQ